MGDTLTYISYVLTHKHFMRLWNAHEERHREIKGCAMNDKGSAYITSLAVHTERVAGVHCMRKWCC